MNKFLFYFSISYRDTLSGKQKRFTGIVDYFLKILLNALFCLFKLASTNVIIISFFCLFMIIIANKFMRTTGFSIKNEQNSADSLPYKERQRTFLISYSIALSLFLYCFLTDKEFSFISAFGYMIIGFVFIMVFIGELFFLHSICEK